MQKDRRDRPLFLLAACLGCALFAETQAAEPWHENLYVGVQAGESTLYNSGHRDVHGKIISSTWTREWTDHSSTSLSAKIGYWISPYFAAEASYWDFGEGTYNELRISGGPILNTDITDRYVGVVTKAKGFAAGIVASYPWHSWRISAKLAALNNEVRNRGTGVGTTRVLLPPGQPQVSRSIALDESFGNTRALYGASVSYTFADHFIVEADWRTARRIGEQTYFDGLNVKTLGLGVQYRF